MAAVRTLLRALLVAVLAVAIGWAAGSGPVLAQEEPQAVETPIDYKAWEKDAATAEEVITAGRASSAAMEEMRARIVLPSAS